MAKNKMKQAEIQPIRNPLNAVVADFKAHMKATGVKVKLLTYDQVLEHLVDHCQNLLAQHNQAEASQS